MKRVFSFLILFIFSALVLGQQLRFKTLSILNGLSQSTVNAIIQDRQGFMWIATQDGLNRFDGYSFRVYKHQPMNRNSLPDNYVQSLFLDHHGTLWIGTYGGGLSSFNPVTEKFTNYRHDPNDKTSLSHNLVMSITEDKDRNLWIGTSMGLNRFSRKTGNFERFIHSDIDDGSLSSNKVRTVFMDNRKNLWVGTAENGLNLYLPGRNSFKRFTADPSKNGSISHNSVQHVSQGRNGELYVATSGGGVNVYDYESSSFSVISESEENEIHFRDTWTVAEDNRGNIWVGTYGSGLLSYDRSKKSTRNFRNDPTNNASLTNNIILCSYRDRNGKIWLGTLGGGVSYFDPGGSPFTNIRHNPADPNSLSENVVMSVFEDDHGLYVGTYGGGLNYRDNKTGRFTIFKNKEGNSSIPSNIIRSIFKDSKGRLWFGFYEGGLAELRNGKFITYMNDPDDPSSISMNDVWCIREDKEGFLWIGTWGGGLNKFDPASGKFISFRNSPDPSSLSNDKVISLLIDSENRIWAGTNGGGLNLLDQSTGKFKQFRSKENDTVSLGSDRVRCIYEDKKGVIWLGTDGGGLNRMNPDGTFTRFNEWKGLPNNVVYGILEDDNGHLWLSTNNGLCRFSTRDFSVRNFDVTDGIQDNEFNQAACFRGRNGQLYFAGINGITVFDPANIKSNNSIPPVVLTSIRLFGKEYLSDTSKSFMKKLLLTYDENFFSFEFSALDFTAPEKNQYACMMEGFDKDWIHLGNKRFVSYTNLDPGEYTFRVKASNNENVWNKDGITFSVIITPPFYKTKLFYFLLVVTGLGSVYLFIFFRTRNLKRAKAELEHEVKVRTKEVVQQKEIIEGKNKDITDSINYARRIQKAIFPSAEYFTRNFPESFILYEPKDIVSGDFYWMETFGEEIFVAVVDCTGHGVPGAFMSIVGNNLLNQAINHLGISKPSLVLNEMNKGLAKMIRNQDDFELKDGMDMALCGINFRENKLQFSGANNPLWIVNRKNGEVVLNEIKGDKKPIGSFVSGNTSLFTNHETELQKGDTIYLTSDGFGDQFGGPQGKKIKKSKLKELLVSIYDLPMQEQREILKKFFVEWKGDFDQVDDVLIVGIRV